MNKVTFLIALSASIGLASIIPAGELARQIQGFLMLAACTSIAAAVASITNVAVHILWYKKAKEGFSPAQRAFCERFIVWPNMVPKRFR
ncbi:hypothetical protein [Neptuniibacter sp. QD37_11]|uniref:hypothetical protein n=1 Tax=Neptuniibacter sp. QD37_11 TaxID=3398209 RepID=UPI0039F464BC